MLGCGHVVQDRLNGFLCKRARCGFARLGDVGVCEAAASAKGCQREQPAKVQEQFSEEFVIRAHLCPCHAKFC